MQYFPLLRSLEGSRKVIERRVLFEYGWEYLVPCEAVVLEVVVRIEDGWIGLWLFTNLLFCAAAIPASSSSKRSSIVTASCLQNASHEILWDLTGVI